jgi:hypothetical protein
MRFYYLLSNGTYISTTDSIDYRASGSQYIEEIYCNQLVIDSSNSDRLDERLSDKEWAWILLKAIPIKIN